MGVWRYPSYRLEFVPRFWFLTNFKKPTEQGLSRNFMKTLFKKSFVLFLILTTFSCSEDSETNSSPVPNCPQGYTGSNCSIQVTPTKISISKIEIVSFPATDPSAVTGFWDYVPLDSSQNAPDIAILFSDATTSTLFSNTSTNAFNNAQANTVYTYTYPNPIQITNVNNLFKIELRDIDSNNTFQSMSTSFFSIYNSFNNFPSVIPIINGNTKYNIYVSYTW